MCYWPYTFVYLSTTVFGQSGELSDLNLKFYLTSIQVSLSLFQETKRRHAVHQYTRVDAYTRAQI